MNYVVSITDFFKSPKWMMNLLLGGICCLIPVIGPMVYLGWLITGFWTRQDKSFETFPEFKFDNFTKYLERGLWPMVVTLTIVFGGYIIMMILMIPFSIILSLFSSHDGHQHGGLIATLFGLIFTLLEFGFIALIFFAIKPLMIRATLLQDFTKSFDLAFVKKFINLTWVEMLVSTIFLSVVGTVLFFAGMIVFCVGIYFAAALVYFAMCHLDKQLYDLYLSRGGEAIPLSPKLSELPPTPPVAAA